IVLLARRRNSGKLSALFGPRPARAFRSARHADPRDAAGERKSIQRTGEEEEMNEATPAANVAEAAQPSRAAFAFIFITVLLDMLAIGIVIPVLPTLVSGFLGGSAASTAEMLGIFGTVWALMQFLASPTMGALSDRFGRRPVILISN